MNDLERFNQSQLNNLVETKKTPEFFPGDTISVKVKIGDRFQNYEGVCIAKRNRGLNSSFTVRKISYGEGVERIFPLYSTNLEEISVLKRGRVKRAKLYYLRNRSGKSARISEANSGYKVKLSKKK